MEYDSESQLFHTLLRYYNPRLGLWMTTDPAGLDASSPSDPQSLNRSAYVGNSPINSVDPLGRNQVKIDAPAPTGPQIDPFDLLNAYSVGITVFFFLEPMVFQQTYPIMISMPLIPPWHPY
jgi:RHS repeat-associated protein